MEQRKKQKEKLAIGFHFFCIFFFLFQLALLAYTIDLNQFVFKLLVLIGQENHMYANHIDTLNFTLVSVFFEKSIMGDLSTFD